MGPGGIHAAQRFQRIFRAETRCIGDDHLRQADDGVQGGAQLVPHAGQKLGLAPARDLQLSSLLLDLAEQPCILDRQHRLRGEGLQQLDGALERIHPAACAGPRARRRSRSARAAVRPAVREAARGRQHRGRGEDRSVRRQSAPACGAPAACRSTVSPRSNMPIPDLGNRSNWSHSMGRAKPKFAGCASSNT